MSRQLLSEGGSFQTPGLEYSIQYPEPGQPGSASALTAKVPIAKPMQMEVAASQVEVSTMVHAALVDAVFHVGEFQLVIALVHPERLITPAHELCAKDAGVIEVDLAPLAKIYRTLRGADSFKAQVRSHIFGEPSSKRWQFHPRCAAQISKWSDRLAEQWKSRVTPPARAQRADTVRRTEVGRSQSPARVFSPPGWPVTFECRCGERWKSPEPGANLVCPQCSLPAPLNAFIVS